MCSSNFLEQNKIILKKLTQRYSYDDEYNRAGRVDYAWFLSIDTPKFQADSKYITLVRKLHSHKQRLLYPRLPCLSIGKYTQKSILQRMNNRTASMLCRSSFFSWTLWKKTSKLSIWPPSWRESNTVTYCSYKIIIKIILIYFFIRFNHWYFFLFLLFSFWIFIILFVYRILFYIFFYFIIIKIVLISENNIVVHAKILNYICQILFV